uniref:Hypertrehalosaemic factor 2 n=3 Tax=Neoptera TaxID=33340 RepID=HTF2_BLAOR|nr:RecName: Full=Hypertrehalosaemic factor 2; AltName: Full=Hypertrehalosaemic factor II; AltName: Full=Neuropeptide M-II; AltName: Full=PeA-CAH-II; AltName: Full=Periplanetin CC-2 [Periplaneta americana]P84257.1 RecName: Full=Hypertrehalosaemic factor 2; AltName: Full=Hypertrehalosaemic factor II; AltName: Full=LeD-CC-II [Leptinotarsa decemlineata]P84258.1 RecName: Full=Hypertrehalosaemic factor 2; AltName: Full=Hypertrehalosaemic factor II; AltName: Full=Hypertrehalosaemic neuropeptide II [Blat
QLTFTPNW